jgi:hypothetical protein
MEMIDQEFDFLEWFGEYATKHNMVVMMCLPSPSTVGEVVNFLGVHVNAWWCDGRVSSRGCRARLFIMVV